MKKEKPNEICQALDEEQKLRKKRKIAWQIFKFVVKVGIFVYRILQRFFVEDDGL